MVNTNELSDRFKESNSGWVKVRGTTDKEIEEAVAELNESSFGYIFEFPPGQEYVTTIAEEAMVVTGESHTFPLYKIFKRGDGNINNTSTLRKVGNAMEMKRVIQHLKQEHENSLKLYAKNHNKSS